MILVFNVGIYKKYFDNEILVLEGLKVAKTYLKKGYPLENVSLRTHTILLKIKINVFFFFSRFYGGCIDNPFLYPNYFLLK